MSFQSHWDVDDRQTVYNNMLNQQYYYCDETHPDVRDQWMMINIHPDLRDSSTLPYTELNGPPMSRYLAEPHNYLFRVDSGNQFEEFCHYDLKTYPVTETLPFALNLRQRSLSPIFQESLSICSSDYSPPSDPLCYQERFNSQQSLGASQLSRSRSATGQGLPDLGWSSIPQTTLPNVGHINLSDVQVIPDPSEFHFQDDEGCMDLELKQGSTQDDDNHTLKVEPHHCHSSDEGLGRSLTCEGSPMPGRPIKNVGLLYTPASVEEDAETESEDEGLPINEEAEDCDEEYNPRASRNIMRRRPAHTTQTTTSPKRGRVQKSAQRNKSSLHCKVCTHIAKDAHALARHAASSHSRPYICAFGFAGCNSTFASKNEWKRHVTSQHLRLHYWSCEPGSCDSSKPGQPANEFNRKDLFTQHLRRMHMPPTVGAKKQKKDTQQQDKWEQSLRDLQESCKRVRREPPRKAACPLDSCHEVFEGAMAWDDRMEHVAKHLKRVVGTKTVLDQGNDPFLLQWAMRERVIGKNEHGEYELRDEGGSAADREDDAEDNQDEDAEGEDE